MATTEAQESKPHRESTRQASAVSYPLTPPSSEQVPRARPKFRASGVQVRMQTLYRGVETQTYDQETSLSLRCEADLSDPILFLYPATQPPERSLNSGHTCCLLNRPRPFPPQGLRTSRSPCLELSSPELPMADPSKHSGLNSNITSDVWLCQTTESQAPAPTSPRPPLPHRSAEFPSGCWLLPRMVVLWVRLFPECLSRTGTEDSWWQVHCHCQVPLFLAQCLLNRKFIEEFQGGQGEAVTSKLQAGIIFSHSVPRCAFLDL